VDDFVFKACINEQPYIDRNHVYEQLEATVTIVPEMDIFNSYILDEIIVLKVDHRCEGKPILINILVMMSNKLILYLITMKIVRMMQRLALSQKT
jgi:hypothetical protein